MNGKAFSAYVNWDLVPTLQPNDVVVLDNLRSHKSIGVRPSIELRGERRCSTCRRSAL